MISALKQTLELTQANFVGLLVVFGVMVSSYRRPPRKVNPYDIIERQKAFISSLQEGLDSSDEVVQKKDGSLDSQKKYIKKLERVNKSLSFRVHQLEREKAYLRRNRYR